MILINQLKTCQSGIKTLKFGWCFNQPVDNLPKNLKIICFGQKFYQNIDNLPDSIEEINFDSYSGKYNLPIKKFPNSLKKLQINRNYSHPLPNNVEIQKI